MDFTGNTVSGYVRGINIDQVTADVTVANNTITAGKGYSAIQISGCAKAQIEGNTIYNQGDFLTFHANLAAKDVANREIAVRNNKVYAVDGVQGYLIYDDICASGYEDNVYFHLIWENNQVDDSIITTQGIKGTNVYDLSTYVSSVLNPPVEVNGQRYSTLEEAVDAAGDGDVVTLVGDVILTGRDSGSDAGLTISKDITIDGQGQYSIIGFLKLQNGTLKDLTATNHPGKAILTIGSADQNDIRMEGVTVKYPVAAAEGQDMQTLTHVLSGNNADITVTGCTFMNEAENGGVTENAPQWSYGLYMNKNSGTFTFTKNKFEGAFRTMLAEINGTVTITDNIFTNSIYSNNSGSTSGAGEEATCITTAKLEPNQFIITGNTFDNAGAFYFQKTEGAMVTGNTFKFDKFEHFIQVSGSAAHELDLSGNTFETGENSVISVDLVGAPILYPAGQKVINYWAWADTKENRPDDYSSYVYAYNADGSRSFYPGSDAALNAFLNCPSTGDISVVSGDTVFVEQNLTLTNSATIPADATLVIGDQVTLTVPEGVTLTNNGTIVNPERISAAEGAIISGAGSETKHSATFQVTPEEAMVIVKDSNGSPVAAGYGNVYYLDNGSYTYTVSADGYYAVSGTMTVAGTAQTIPVTLSEIPVSTGSTTYSVSVSSAANGKVTTSTSRASKGSTVTLTVKPDEGYALDQLTVTDANGKAVSVTKVNDTKYTFKMPASKVSVKVTFEKAEPVSSLPFTDVDVADWFYEAVEYVYDNGMMNGTTSTKFGPDAQLTRGMIVTILYRLEGEPTVSGNDFVDVNPSQYYADPIAWAAKNGIVTGYGDGTFGPENSITREQLAAILSRYASYKGYSVSKSADLSAYTDASSISSYAKDAMAWANAEGLITGVTATTLNPKDTATRAQVATILMRFCENVAK